MAQRNPSQLRALRERAEHLLGQGQDDDEVISLLRALVSDAEAGSEPALFAHRQLAELELERAPWKAALHLRQVQCGGAADDGVHALMGLCQALLGNFRAAVASYRRALSLAPDNPWYRHNLGHLLDVGLGDSEAALKHLRLAQRMEGAEDEITASLAHCLARLGELVEASSMARSAVDLAPQKGEHRNLLDWVERGAPGELTPPSGAGRRTVRGRPTVDVPQLLARQMGRAGFSSAQIERALSLWQALEARGRVQGVSAPVVAAAVEYAIARAESVTGVTQAQVARRYGVAPRSVSQRFGEIRRLSLLPELAP